MTRLALIPGLAVDGRLFEPQRALPFEIVAPPWIAARRGESLERYAARLADGVGRVDAVGGVSIGGMLAQAMAARIGARVVIGIATARSGRDVPAVLRFAEAMSRALPALRGRAGRLVPGLDLLGRLVGESRRRLLEMLGDADLELVRDGARMISEWRGSPTPCPARFVHGSRDLLIPLGGVRPDLVIRGGGHLINVTHARAVNEFIVDSLRKAGLEPESGSAASQDR